MRCKAGDIALVVGSIADNLGRLVMVRSRAVRFDGTPGWLVRCVAGRTLGGREAWDAPILRCECVTFADTDLRPIPGLSFEMDTSTFLPRLRKVGEDTARELDART